MVYVGIRTGEVLGYIAAQAQWGQQTAGFAEYWHGIEEVLFSPPSGTLIPVTIAVSMGYLLLFCLIVFDQHLRGRHTPHKSHPHHIPARIRT